MYIFLLVAELSEKVPPRSESRSDQTRPAVRPGRGTSGVDAPRGKTSHAFPLTHRLSSPRLASPRLMSCFIYNAQLIDGALAHLFFFSFF